jgi:cytochrome c oxidase assembly protein Cox11
MSGSKALAKKQMPKKEPSRVQPFRQNKKMASAIHQKSEAHHKKPNPSEEPVVAPATYHGKPEKAAEQLEGKVRTMSIDEKK